MPATEALTQLLHDVLTSRVYDVARETPLEPAHRLSRRFGNTILFKREDLQPVFSFKLRGAYNKIAHLTAAERGRGIIAASAGNHAQGVAYAARELGLRAVIVMPQTTPQIKVDAVNSMGAEVVLIGDSYPDAQAHCDVLIAETGMTFVHPFDDPVVLAGAGTVGLEIMEDAGEIDTVIVPVGGGGLMGGVTSAVKGMRADVRMVAVELEEGPGLGPALVAGKPVPAPRPATLADGMTPPFVGALPLAIAREAVDAVVTVTEPEIIEAMRFLITRAKLYVEGSGAAATAALLAGKIAPRNHRPVVAIVSGGNIDPERLATVFAPG